MLKLLLAIAAMVAVPVAFAAGSTPLDSYLDGMKTLRATFVQTLADAHGREIDRASGTLIVSRPGKFSWDNCVYCEFDRVCPAGRDGVWERKRSAAGYQIHAALTPEVAE